MRPTRTLVLLIIAGLLLATGIVMARANPETQGVPTMASSSNTSRFGDYQPISPELFRELNPLEEQVILRKGTERAFTGAYTDLEDAGTFYCRQCDSPLYSSEDKFHSGCGWPAFDTELPGAVTRIPDPDGMRTGIVCSTCNAHLGHVFLGEGFTDTDTRHCVNSISMVFRPEMPKAKAVFSGGCFWGVEYLFEKLPGVYAATSGYTGGQTVNPTYREVLTHTTGHLEAVEVVYNPLEISYEDLAKYFFEIHDPTQTNGQGPDIGNQYLSAVFYRSRSEYDTALELIGILESKGYKIATTLRPAAVFWPAEEYHQDYYDLKGTTPYCHSWTKKF